MKARDNGGAQRKKKKTKAPSRSDENGATQKRKAGGGGGPQPPGGSQRPSRRHTQGESARRAGLREAEKNKQNTGPRPRAPRAANQRKPETTGAHRRGGGGGATTGERPTGRQHKESKSARRAKKREASKTNNAKPQGPRHPGPATRKGKRQRGHKAKKNGQTKKKNKKKKSKAKAEGPKQGLPQTGGGPAREKDKAATGKCEAHQNAPGRPARPTRPRRARTRTHARDPGVASSDPQGEVSASTRNSPGALAESPVERRTVRETGRVSDRVHTRQPTQGTQPKTGAGGTRQGQPHRGAPNGYDAERAQRSCLGGGQRQAQ